MGSSEPAVDIVTVTYDSATHLAAYFEGVSALDYPRERLRLFVVDNASNDDTRRRLSELLPRLPFPGELIESESNTGFGDACNRGVARGSAPFVLFLNPDAVAAPDMLRRLAGRALAEQRAGLVDAAQEPFDPLKWCDPASGDTDWCSGAALLARREALTEVGGFDPFFFLYCEDVDLSWRMWLAGWRCVHEASARVRHEVGLPGGRVKPSELLHMIRNSFAMRFIYDAPRGALAHLVRGARYLASPRTEAPTRRAVAAGMWRAARGARHLLGRRRAAQSALRDSKERARFVFTEWYCGRWLGGEGRRP
jgi:GT2 family glycosyltransferase